MLNVKRGVGEASNAEQAVEKLVSEIKQPDANLVIFFASSTYDFEVVSKKINDEFESAEVIGCTTSGEIGPQGFKEGTIVGMSIASDDFTPATAVIKDTKLKAMLSKNDVIDAFKRTGLDMNDPDVNQKGFGIMLTDGLQAGEEKVLSVVNSVAKDFTVVGGTAADDMKFEQVYVSANGEVYTNSAVVTFVKTNKKFYTYKENIYAPGDTEFKVTKADMNARIVYEFDNRPAAEVYAEALGLKKEDLSLEQFMNHPIGRQYGDSIWIITPWQVLDNGGIQLYAQVLPNSTVKLLNPIDTIEQAKDTVKNVKENLPNVKAVIGFNCTLRYVRFKEEKSCPGIYNELKQLGEVIAFNSYGEQYAKHHVNQTLTLIALGE